MVFGEGLTVVKYAVMTHNMASGTTNDKSLTPTSGWMNAGLLVHFYLRKELYLHRALFV